jgi:hypothetical protein
MVLCEIIATEYDERARHGTIAGSTNTACRRICQPQPLRPQLPLFVKMFPRSTS